MKQLIVEVEYKRTAGMLIEIPDEHQTKSEWGSGLGSGSVWFSTGQKENRRQKLSLDRICGGAL
jgi:hypothetical protein